MLLTDQQFIELYGIDEYNQCVDHLKKLYFLYGRKGINSYQIYNNSPNGFINFAYGKYYGDGANDCVLYYII